MIGVDFIWSNGHIGDDNIQCRLDRSMVSSDFLTFKVGSPALH